MSTLRLHYSANIKLRLIILNRINQQNERNPTSAESFQHEILFQLKLIGTGPKLKKCQ
ncbi:unnamed protein product [Tenebrio molitor]|nr:unnamed protein product [Tenebrio molitor]